MRFSTTTAFVLGITSAVAWPNISIGRREISLFSTPSLSTDSLSNILKIDVTSTSSDMGKRDSSLLSTLLAKIFSLSNLVKTDTTSTNIDRRNSSPFGTLHKSLGSLSDLFRTDTTSMTGVLNAGMSSSQSTAAGMSAAVQVAYALSSADFSSIVPALKDATTTVGKTTMKTSGGLFKSGMGMGKYEATMLGQDVNSVVSAIQGFTTTMDVAMSDMKLASSTTMDEEDSAVVSQVSTVLSAIKPAILAFLTPLHGLLMTSSSGTMTSTLSLSGWANAMQNLEDIIARLSDQTEA